MNNLKKNHRLTVVLFSFVSGILIFPQLVLAESNQSDYVGISATYRVKWEERTIHRVRSDGDTEEEEIIVTRTRDISISGGMTGSFEGVSRQLASLVNEAIDALIGRLSRAWVFIRTLFSRQTGEDIQPLDQSYFPKNQEGTLVALNINDDSSNLSEESLITINKMDKDFELIERNMKEFKVNLTGFYDNGNFDLRFINSTRNSSQKLRQSLSNFLINFKTLSTLSNNNSSPELMLAKQEILKSTQDVINILEFTDKVLNAFDKAIAQSE